MKAAAYEAVVENGQIKLSEPLRLPERAKVYVLVTGPDEAPGLHMNSPRLAQRERAVDFAKEVVEEARDAGLR
jgi:hypothetical protein